MNQKRLVYIHATPEDSVVYLEGQPIGIDSGVFEITDYSKKTLSIEARKENYQTKNFQINRKVNPATYYNFAFLLFSPILFFIDYLTDNFFTYSPKNVFLEMEKKIEKADEAKQNFEPISIPYQANNKKSKVYQYYFKNFTLTKVGGNSEIKVNPSPFKPGMIFYNGVEVEPGEYIAKGILELEEKNDGSSISLARYTIVTYTANSYVSRKIRIQEGGDTVICGGFDLEKDSSLLFSYHIQEKISQKYNYNIDANYTDSKFFPYFFDACPYPDSLKKSETTKVKKDTYLKQKRISNIKGGHLDLNRIRK